MYDPVGKLIIATPKLDETPFSQAVVLVVQQNETGIFGVVLNRPANDHVKRLWRTITGCPRSDSENYISLGGPLNGPVFALHQDSGCSEQKVECGLYFATSPKNLRKLALEATRPFRIFFGAVAWQEGQLEKELESGVWVACTGTKDLIFADARYQWELSLRSYGRELLASIGIDRFPVNPEHN